MAYFFYSTNTRIALMSKKLRIISAAIGLCLSSLVYATPPLVIAIDGRWTENPYTQELSMEDCKKHIHFGNRRCIQLGQEYIAKYISKAMHTRVKIQNFNNIRALETALDQRKVDFALLYPRNFKNMIDQNPKKITPLLTVMEHIDKSKPLKDYYYSDLIVSKDSKINSIADLKGKKIGIRCNSLSSEVVPWMLLKKQKIDPNQDIQIEYFHSPKKLTHSLVEHKVDAIFVWNYYFKHHILGYKLKNENFKKLMSYKIPNMVFVSNNKSIDHSLQKQFSQAMLSLPQDAFIGLSFQGVSPYQEKNYKEIFKLLTDYNKLDHQPKACSSKH